MIEVQGYSNAIFDIAIQNNDLLNYYEQIKILSSLMNKDFKKFYFSNFIDKQEKKKVIKEIFNDFNQNIVNLLLLLLDFNKQVIVGEVFNHFIIKASEELKILKIKIYSSTPIPENDLFKILNFFEGKKYEYQLIVDKEILAGYKIVINDKRIIDTSLSKKLDDIKKELKKEVF